MRLVFTEGKVHRALEMPPGAGRQDSAEGACKLEVFKATGLAPSTWEEVSVIPPEAQEKRSSLHLSVYHLPYTLLHLTSDWLMDQSVHLEIGGSGSQLGLGEESSACHQSLT